ncbi:hypothetical protein [uncultured Alistipes sp.]|jgi:hypothetical protein|uniref:hypothetical protein n=1 Tax=uncultured Alistipes sp. TaxID=538949 RepID=UPI0025F27E76|nr:hypothetical protein [uncultured Alistipes sp.]
MKKIIVYALILLTALSLSSCRKAVEKARQNIRFEGIEKVERQGLTGVEIVARVMNNTGHKLVLETALLDVYYAGGRVASVILREPVEVQRRTHESFSSLWRIKISDPLAIYVMARKFQQNDISQIGVSFSVEGRGGPAPVRFSQEMMPLSEFLNIFGLSLQDVKNYLKE